MGQYIVITTTIDTKEKAQEIAAALVVNQLAACVHIDSIESTYMRNGWLQDEKEYRVVIKTKDYLFDDVAVKIRELHTYETPQIIATPITYITESYSKRLDANTRSIG